MTDSYNSLRNLVKSGPGWQNMLLEVVNAEINSAGLELLIEGIEQMKGAGANFRFVFKGKGVALEVEGDTCPVPDAIEEEQKVRVHPESRLKLL